MRANQLRYFRKMARPKGFEPLTPRFVVWCSIQLSYGRVSMRAGRVDLDKPSREPSFSLSRV